MTNSNLPFVDGVTDLNALTFNKLEVAANKAQANGYASLDGTGKVPAAQLPPGGGVVVPPVVNGQWLKGVGGAAVWTPLAIVDADVAAGAAIAGSKVAPQFGSGFTVTPTGAVDQLSPVVTRPGWYYGSSGTHYLYSSSDGVLATLDAVQIKSKYALRHPFTATPFRHLETGAISSGPGGATVSFTAAFAAVPSVVVSPYNTVANPTSTNAPTTTAVTVYSSVATTVSWMAEGQDP